MDLAELVDKVKLELTEEGQSIPELCRLVKETDEYQMMKAIAKLEDTGFAILNDFKRIYREDGGAIYLAKYSRRTS